MLASKTVHFSESLLDLFFPRKCVGCGEIGSWVCPRCIVPPDLQESEGVWSVFSLEKKVVRELLHYLKYNGVFECAAVLVSMVELDDELRDLLSGAALVPVPTSRARVKMRGYNQAELIARALGEKFGCSFRDVLARQVTKTLVGSGKEERQKLVAGSFAMQPSCISNSEPVVLIDDVVTTGSTLSECKAVLESAGFCVRGCLAIARKELE